MWCRFHNEHHHGRKRKEACKYHMNNQHKSWHEVLTAFKIRRDRGGKISV